MQQRQQGLTAISWTFVILIGGVIILSVIKMAPIYMQSFTVASSMKSLGELPDIGEKDDDEIVDMLKKRLDINDVKIVKADEAVIVREDGYITISLEYEVRRPYMGNIDAILKFKHSTELGGR